jgi:hypothetical protein
LGLWHSERFLHGLLLFYREVFAIFFIHYNPRAGNAEEIQESAESEFATAFQGI